MTTRIVFLGTCGGAWTKDMRRGYRGQRSRSGHRLKDITSDHAPRIISSWVLLLAAGLHAQSWCPPDAAWTFDYYDQLFGTGCTVSTTRAIRPLRASSAETGALGVPTAVVLGNLIPNRALAGPVHLRGGRGRIPSRRLALAFDTLMWFSSAPGDGIGGARDDGYRLHGAGHLYRSSRWCAVATARRQIGPEGWYPVDTLRERIGFRTTYLRPMESLVIDGNWKSSMLRRSKRSRSLHHGSPTVDSPCQRRSRAGNEQRTLPESRKRSLTISLPLGAHRIMLVDITGNEVLHTQANGTTARNSRPVNSPPGFVFIRIDDAVSGTRWMKSDPRDIIHRRTLTDARTDVPIAYIAHRYACQPTNMRASSCCSCCFPSPRRPAPWRRSPATATRWLATTRTRSASMHA